jgi:hypothetical protein
MRGGSLAVVALALGLAACAKPKPASGPVDVVKRFLAASQERDASAVYALLGPATRARLQAAAALATEQAGRKPPFAPHEMLSAGFRPSVSGDWTPRTYRLLEQSADAARVEVVGKKPGQRDVVRLVRVDGHWRIELPVPSLPGRETAPAPPPP